MRAVEASKDIETWIDEVVSKSNSLAFIGILVSIAKKSPKLLRAN